MAFGATGAKMGQNYAAKNDMATPSPYALASKPAAPVSTEDFWKVNPYSK